MTRIVPLATALLFAFTMQFAFDASLASAQHHRSLFRAHDRSLGPGYRVQGYPYPVDYPVYGYGYVFDPYARGTFELPDPMDDPYLRARYKYDTFFPGRRSRRLRRSHRH